MGRDHRKELRRSPPIPSTLANLWHNKDKPFRYVSACRELAAAWRKPGIFVTHLPIPFDGSCNGYNTFHCYRATRNRVRALISSIATNRGTFTKTWPCA